MFVTIPNAENYQFHRGLFIAAWKVWFKRFSDNPDNWKEGRMPVCESEHGLAALLDEGKRFSLEVICRLMVPWNYRNRFMADSHFLHMNPDLLRSVSFTTQTGERVQGVRLADQAIDMWEELTYIEQDIFMIFAEARIQADIESTSSEPIVIDDAGIDLIGDDIYPPLVPEKGDPQSAYIHALAAWIQEDPFQPLYHRQPYGDPVSGWNHRLRATFWPKPRANYMVNSHLADPLLYRCRLLGEGLDQGKEWDYEDKLLAHKTVDEILMLFGLPQREFNAEDVEKVFRAAIFEEENSTAKMNSGWSKVACFATHFLEEKADRVPQITWNSRISTSVVSRLDFLLVEAGIDDPAEIFPGIGIVEGWGGTRPRELSLNWPNAYRKWPAQLAASRLMKQLRDHLNTATNAEGKRMYPEMPLATGGHGLWTINGLQQVLSADGY
jgi:hypothetical protein